MVALQRGEAFPSHLERSVVRDGRVESHEEKEEDGAEEPFQATIPTASP